MLTAVRKLRENQRVNLRIWIERKVLLLTEYSNSVVRKEKEHQVMNFVDRTGSKFNKF
jgi:hypothetical protein